MQKIGSIVLLIVFASITQAMPPVQGIDDELWQDVFKEKLRLGIDNITDPVRDAGKEGVFNTDFSAPQRLVSGLKNIAAACIDFSDYTYAYDTSYFQNMFFGSWGSGSVRDYYTEVSYGYLDLAGQVDGWHRADNSHSYYGYDNGWVRAARLAKEAAEEADANLDYSQFDNNGDGYVDVFTVVHSGYGREESGDGDDIWSHAWSFYSAGIGVYVSDDPDPNDPGEYIKVNRYTIQPELSSYSNYDTLVCIGVFCHEWGHAFGLPDLYDTDGGGAGLGNWCCMATGSWGGNGQSPWAPAFFSAWAKTDLGWLAPTTVNFNKTYDIPQVETNAQCYLVRTAYEPREYFMVENRQHVSFDSTLHNTGLCIYHIDEEIINLRRYYNQVNAGGDYPYGVALEQADGMDDLWVHNNRGDSGDVYPGSTNNTAFDSAGTVPDSRTNDDEDSWCGVNQITSSASVMQAFMYVFNQDELVSVGDGPFLTEVLPDGEYVYITNLLSNNVSIIRTANNIPYVPFSVGDGPMGVSSVPASDYVYITNFLTNNVSVWDSKNDTLVTAIPVGDGPNYALAHPNGDYVYITNENSDNISVIRTSDNTVTATIPVGDGPCCADTLPGTDHMYVTHMYSDTVLVIRTSDNTVVDTIPVGDYPLGVAVLPSAEYVYVTNHNDDNVSVIRTADNTVVETIVVGDGPNKIVAHPSGEYLYVTNDSSDNVSVIRTSDNTVIQDIPVGDNPIGIDIHPGGHLLYVANYNDDNVQVINTPSILPPAAPSVTSEKLATHIVLRWHRVTDIWGNTEDVRQYNIYRDVSPNFVPSISNLLTTVYPPETTYTDTSILDSLGNFYYLVTAVDSMDQVSEKSNMSYKFDKFLNENTSTAIEH